MTLKQAAQTALDVQDACNLSGVAKTLAGPVMDALWEHHHNNGTVPHPIVTLFLLKMCELNGCGSTLHESYEPAEAVCKEIASADV